MINGMRQDWVMSERERGESSLVKALHTIKQGFPGFEYQVAVNSVNVVQGKKQCKCVLVSLRLGQLLLDFSSGAMWMTHAQRQLLTDFGSIMFFDSTWSSNNVNSVRVSMLALVVTFNVILFRLSQP